MNTVEEDLFSGFKTIAGSVPINEVVTNTPNQNSVQKYNKQLVQYIYQRGEQFTLLASDKGDPIFLSKLSNLDRNIWKNNPSLTNLTVPHNYAFTGLLALITSLINEWVKNSFQESPEEFEDILNTTISPILLGNLINKD